MFLKWLFGETTPVEFDVKKIPKGEDKFTLTDAKRLLKEHLINIRYGDRDEINNQLMAFSDYVSYFKDNIKDEVDSVKEDLKDEKQELREAKNELSAFKKSKAQYVKNNSIEDYDYELAHYLSVVEEHEQHVADSANYLESQKLISRSIPPATKLLLPRFIKGLNDESEPSDKHYDPPIRIWIKYQSQRSSIPDPVITEREVDVYDLSPNGFSGHCLLRNDRRNFSFSGVLSYRDRSNIASDQNIFDYFLNSLDQNK